MSSKAPKKKAWTYEETPAPGWPDWFAGAARRRRFLDYWVRDNIGNGIELLLFFVFRPLPAGLVSDIGARLGRLVMPRLYARGYARAQANLRAILPLASEDEIARRLAAFAESQGRQHAEYAVVQRIARSRRRVRRVGTEGLAERCAGRPVIFIGLHTSNWEVMMQCLVDMGLDISLNYAPPKQRARHWIVRYVRRRGGLRLFKPGRSAVRPALRLLEENGKVMIFCDEGFGGLVKGPLFGRPPHLQGNYALVARLARTTGALLCPVYALREGGARFSLHALAPIDLPPEDIPGSRLLDDVALINAAVEPVIAEHPEQWYFVNNRIEPL